MEIPNGEIEGAAVTGMCEEGDRVGGGEGDAVGTTVRVEVGEAVGPDVGDEVTGMSEEGKEV